MPATNRAASAPMKVFSSVRGRTGPPGVAELRICLQANCGRASNAPHVAAEVDQPRDHREVPGGLCEGQRSSLHGQPVRSDLHDAADQQPLVQESHRSGLDRVRARRDLDLVAQHRAARTGLPGAVTARADAVPVIRAALVRLSYKARSRSRPGGTSGPTPPRTRRCRSRRGSRLSCETDRGPPPSLGKRFTIPYAICRKTPDRPACCPGPS